jgi:hypothetical protein
MKLYLLVQGIFHFVDGSLSCPPSHIAKVDSSVGSSPYVNPSFLC